MMNAINWNQEILIDESVEKVNYHEYSPHTGTDLNAQFSDIRIEIQNQDQFCSQVKAIYILKPSLVMESHINTKKILD